MRKNRLRAEHSAIYHISSRIYRDINEIRSDEDKSDLLSIIRKTAEFCGVEVMTFTLMDNHFHLLVSIPKWYEINDDDLIKRMRAFYGDVKTDQYVKHWELSETQIDQTAVIMEKDALKRRIFNLTAFVKTFKEYYTRSHNKRHGTKGQVWGGARFKSVLVSRDFNSVVTTACYIDLNAVRAKIVEHPNKYKWCGLGRAKNGDAHSLKGLRLIVAMRDNRTSDSITDQEALQTINGFLVGTRNTKKVVDSDTPTECPDINTVDMWTRRIFGFLDGLIFGPLTFVLEARDVFRYGSRWHPSSINGIYMGVKTRKKE